MKISKAQIKKIIREEVTKVLREDASDDTFEMVDVIVQALGPQQALEELVQAMERSNAQDLLGYVMRMHDMRMPGDEVEDYDPEPTRGPSDRMEDYESDYRD
jgi:threonine dehydrogenase-like Zn-dependent dehydrogenase